MDDSDFESLRLAFNRSGKRTKIYLPKASLDGQAAKNREFSPWANNLSDESSAPCGPSEEEQLSHSRKLEIKLELVKDKTIESGHERSILHQQQDRDYLGRTYMHVPMDLDVQLDKDPGSFECFAPKRIVHTWTGHSKGVNAIRFFPKSGHLLLSASQDCRIKV